MVPIFEHAFLTKPALPVFGNSERSLTVKIFHQMGSGPKLPVGVSLFRDLTWVTLVDFRRNKTLRKMLPF